MQGRTQGYRSQVDAAAYTTEAVKWDEYNEELLKRIFTNTTVSDDYNGSSFGVLAFDEAQAFQNFVETTNRRIAKLQSILERLDLYPEPTTQANHSGNTTRTRDMSKVFVVHGHDEGAREAVARFLERLGIKPIILHEQVNQGRTVIEKIEAHGEVTFAVVLLTPDDVGCIKGGTPTPRARQNVLLELGYFIGRLNRKHVCALKRGDLEIPSDFGGVVYEQFDDGGGWRQKLAAELEAAGFAINWNTVMRP